MKNNENEWKKNYKKVEKLKNNEKMEQKNRKK